MAKTLREKLTSLDLSAEDVKRNNPRWTDEMVRDYISLTESISLLADLLDDEVSLFGRGAQSPFQLGLSSLVASPKSEAGLFPQFLLPQKQNKQSFAWLYLAAYQPVIASASTDTVTGFARVSDGFSTTTNSIIAIKSGVYKLSFSCGIDSTDTKNVSAELYVNGAATGIKSTITPEGNALAVDDFSMLSFSQPVKASKGDVFTVVLSHQSAFSVTLDLIDINFGASQ